MASNEANIQPYFDPTAGDVGGVPLAGPVLVGDPFALPQTPGGTTLPATDLLARWLPALAGVEAKLRAGARVADVCAGAGAAMVLLAQAFPQSKFFGFDTDEDAIETARKAARTAGVTARAYFQLASPVDFPGWDFDLITCFENVQHLNHPAGAARRVRSGLTPDGTWMVVEHRPGATARPAISALDSVDSEKRLRQVAQAAGFTRFRRAAETLSHVIYEVRI